MFDNYYYINSTKYSHNFKNKYVTLFFAIRQLTRDWTLSLELMHFGERLTDRKIMWHGTTALKVLMDLVQSPTQSAQILRARFEHEKKIYGPRAWFSHIFAQCMIASN